MSTIYLDYAAATPLDEDCLQAMKPYFTNEFYNPSATYLAGRKAKEALEQARSSVAQTIGARPSEIIFTAGGTEANNLAIQGIMNNFPGKAVLTSSIEHDSVLAPAKQFTSYQIEVDESGELNLAHLRAKISDDTVLVSIMYVNNEIGTAQPLREIASILRQVRNRREKDNIKLPLYFHTDAAQAGGYLDLHASRLGVDLMTINGGKLYGPKQSGVLYIKTGVEIMPLIYGGGQERGLRSGTENLAGAAGFALALGKAQIMRVSESKRLMELKNIFAKELQNIDRSININGSLKHSSPHILNVAFDGIDNERLMMELDEAGVISAVGSACSASSSEPSHVLSAIGLSKSEARSSLRFSFGRQTSKDDLLRSAELIRHFLKK
jgi:cysteine desulfurase